MEKNSRLLPLYLPMTAFIAFLAISHAMGQDDFEELNILGNDKAQVVQYFREATKAYHSAWKALTASAYIPTEASKQLAARCALALGWERLDYRSKKYADTFWEFRELLIGDEKYGNYRTQPPRIAPERETQWGQDVLNTMAALRVLCESKRPSSASSEMALLSELNVRLLMMLGDHWRSKANKGFEEAFQAHKLAAQQGTEDRQTVQNAIVRIRWRQSLFNLAMAEARQIPDKDEHGIPLGSQSFRNVLRRCADFLDPKVDPFVQNILDTIPEEGHWAEAFPPLIHRPVLTLPEPGQNIQVGKTLERLAQDWPAIEPPRGRALAGYFAAAFLWQANQFQEAMNAFQGVSRLPLGPGNLDVQRHCLAHSGMLHVHFLQYEEAKRDFEALLKASKEANDPIATCEAELGLGLVAYVREIHESEEKRNFSYARQRFEKVIVMLKSPTAIEESERLRLLVTARINIANIYFRQQDYEMARTELEAAQKELDSLTVKPKEICVVLQGNLGEVYARLRGKQSESRRCFTKAFDLEKELGYPDLRAELFAMQARSLRRTDPHAALNFYLQALDPMAQLRRGLKDIMFKVKFFEKKMATYEEALQFAFDLADRKYGRQAAFLVTEQAKAQAFMDLLRQNNVAEPGKNLPSEFVNLSKAQNLLPDNSSILIQYFCAPKRIYVWAISKKDWEAEALSEHKTSEVRTQIGAFCETVTTDALPLLNPKFWNSIVYLRKALFPESIAKIIQQTPNPRRLIILPDGELYKVPFEVLVPAMPTQIPAGGYLIKEFDAGISYAPSTTALNDLQHQRNMRNLLGLASLGLLAEVLFPRPIRVFAMRSFGSYMGQVPPDLNQVPEEVKAICEAFPKNVVDVYANFGDYSHRPPTKARFRQVAEQPSRYIHISTHGVFLDSATNRNFAILLAKESPKDNGCLMMADALEMRLHTDLLTLSCCKTGMGEEKRTYRGEGIVGISRAFLARGAPAVVVSLWSVPDDETTKLMGIFYKNLSKGMDPSTALAQAKRTMITNGTDPLGWAPFILVGDYRR